MTDDPSAGSPPPSDRGPDPTPDDDAPASRPTPVAPTPRRGRVNRRRAQLGEALGRSFAIWGTNLVPFALLALLIYWPMVGVKYWYFSSDPISLDNPESFEEIMDFMFVAGGLSLFEGVFMNMVLVGTLTVLVVRRLQNNPVDFTEGLKQGMSSIPRMIGVALMIGLLLGLPAGVVILLAEFVHEIFYLLMLVWMIFGIVLWVKWYVAIPVAVIEKPGVMASLVRSGTLVKGRGWAVFGMSILMSLIIGMMQAPLMIIPALLSISEETSMMIENVWIPTFAFVVMTPLSATFTALVYHALREEKDGPQTENLAEVFS